VKSLRTKVSVISSRQNLWGSFASAFRDQQVQHEQRERRFGQSSTRCAHRRNSHLTGQSSSRRKLVFVHALSFFSTSQPQFSMKKFGKISNYCHSTHKPRAITIIRGDDCTSICSWLYPTTSEEAPHKICSPFEK